MSQTEIGGARSGSGSDSGSGGGEHGAGEIWYCELVVTRADVVLKTSTDH